LCRARLRANAARLAKPAAEKGETRTKFGLRVLHLEKMHGNVGCHGDARELKGKKEQNVRGPCGIHLGQRRDQDIKNRKSNSENDNRFGAGLHWINDTAVEEKLPATAGRRILFRLSTLVSRRDVITANYRIW
jgi:hypothetical protein